MISVVGQQRTILSAQMAELFEKTRLSIMTA